MLVALPLAPFWLLFATINFPFLVPADHSSSAVSAFPPSPNKSWLPGQSLADLPLPQLPDAVIEKLLAAAKPRVEAPADVPGVPTRPAPRIV